METCLTTFQGVNFLALEGFVFWDLPFEEYPAHCGAGDGLGNMIIPDVISSRGQKFYLSPACDIHDYMYKIALPTWEDFHISNYCFGVNIRSIFKYFSPGGDVSIKCKIVAWAYEEAVDLLGGQFLFWGMKLKQGYILPFEIRKFLAVYPHTGLGIRELRLLDIGECHGR